MVADKKPREIRIIEKGRRKKEEGKENAELFMSLSH